VGSYEPGDQQVGARSREALLRMDADFCIALTAAIDRGDEFASPCAGEQKRDGKQCTTAPT
jgi:hypothetical protein